MASTTEVVKSTPSPALPTKSTATPAASVQIRIDLPHSLFESYLAMAQAHGQLVEEWISAHLAATATQDHTAAGLWFDAPHSRALCDLTGRGMCYDPPTVIRRLRSLAEVLVGDVIVELNADIMERLKHIRRHLTPAEFVRHEALNGVREALGMSRTATPRPPRTEEPA